MKSKSLFLLGPSTRVRCPRFSVLPPDRLKAGHRALVLACVLFLVFTAALAPAADLVWTNAAGGNWNTATNWSPNTVPGSSDSALITNSGSYTVTLDVNATATSLTLGGASGTQTLSASGRTFTLNGASAINGNGVMMLGNSTLAGTGTLTNQGTLTNDNSTINAALVNQGLLFFQNSDNNLNGSFENQAGATMLLQGGGIDAPVFLTVASGFTNSGTIELTSVGNAREANLNVSSGSLVNAADGQINVLAGTGGPRVLAVQLDNRGTVTINLATTLSQASADHLNSGTITLSGGDLTLSQSGTTPSFTTTGPIDIPSGRTFTVSGGTFNYNAGTVGGAGTLLLISTVANFTPNFSNGTTTLRLNSTTLNGPGTVSNAVGKTFNVDNSTINAALVNQGLLFFQNSGNNLNGSFENQAGATMLLQGGGIDAPVFLTVASGFTNSGTIELTSVGNAREANLNVSSGSLVNAADGQINVLAGTGGPRVLAVQLDNRGTVTINLATTLSQVSADHLNSGTITLSGGDLTLSQSGTTPSFTTTGPIDIGSGRTFTVSGGTFNYNAGTLGGAGTLNLSSTTANFTPNFSTGTTTLRLASTTLNGPGTVSNAVGKTFNVDNSTINAALVNQGLLFFQNSGNNLNGSFENQAGATMLLQGGGIDAPVFLTVASGFTNSGTIELTSVGNAREANLNVSSGSLVNAAGGQINVLAGTGGPRVLAVQLDNRGTVTINLATTLSQASADHLNSGTITLSGGNFTVSQSGTTPSFLNTGILTIPAGRSFIVSGGTLINGPAGLIQGSGTLDVTSALFTNAGTVAPGVSPGILTIAGNYNQTVTGMLQIEVGGTVPGTTFDRFDVSGMAQLNGTLDVTLTSGFVPNVDDTFRILNFASRNGDFLCFNGLNLLSVDRRFKLVYSPTGLDLVVTNGAAQLPTLIHSRQGAQLLLCWPTEYEGFTLQSNTNLNTSDWTAFPLTGSNMTLFLPTDAQRYFRLHKP